MNCLEHFLRPTQRQLFKRLCKKFNVKTLISKGNFILVRGQAPIMLVAHMDTVHEQPVRDICISADGNIIMSPQGIGGVGSKAFCLAHKQRQLPKEIDDLKFIIELDRKGYRDAVFYNCANTDFETYITNKGFKSAQGSFSDISLIAPELGVAAVNLSSGYHYAHSLHEYINRAELNATIDKVIDIISDASNLPRFEYVERIQHFEPCKAIRRVNSFSLPRNLPAELQDIYEFLLDIYSVDELETFRAELGDNFLWQIYYDEIAPFYRR